MAEPTEWLLSRATAETPLNDVEILRWCDEPLTTFERLATSAHVLAEHGRRMAREIRARRVQRSGLPIDDKSDLAGDVSDGRVDEWLAQVVSPHSMVERDAYKMARELKRLRAAASTRDYAAERGIAALLAEHESRLAAARADRDPVRLAAHTYAASEILGKIADVTERLEAVEAALRTPVVMLK